MNSWQIIKNHFTNRSKNRPESFGRCIELNQAAELFTSLMENFEDKDLAVEDFNSDKDVGKAILARKNIEELRNAGVLS